MKNTGLFVDSSKKISSKLDFELELLANFNMHSSLLANDDT